jgi:hypothetical protein
MDDNRKIRKIIKTTLNEWLNENDKIDIKKTLNKIAKDSVISIGEDTNCDLEGRCGQISEDIYEKLNNLGIDNDIIKVTSGYIGNEKSESFTTHYYVFVYDYNLIVDTQLWQVNQQPKDLKKRKCVFEYEEYLKYFKPTETEKIT